MAVEEEEKNLMKLVRRTFYCKLGPKLRRFFDVLPMVNFFLYFGEKTSQRKDMAVEALGWLGSKCGVDFGGKKKSPAAEERGGTEGMFTKMNDAVFGSGQAPEGNQGDPLANIQDGQDGPQPPPLPPQGTTSPPAQRGGPRRVDAEGVEVDENGLPLERNYYFFNKEKGIWDVTDDAPESVKQEHAAKLAELTAPKAELPPPPPPPPSMPTPQVSASPTSPQYANDGFFSPAPLPAPPGLGAPPTTY